MTHDLAPVVEPCFYFKRSGAAFSFIPSYMLEWNTFPTQDRCLINVCRVKRRKLKYYVKP